MRIFKELWENEEGIGTVEMILILVDIFDYKRGVNNVDYGCSRGRSKTLYTVDK